MATIYSKRKILYIGWLERDSRGKLIKRAESLRLKDTRENRRLARQVKKEKELELSRPQVIKSRYFFLNDAWNEFISYKNKLGGRSGRGITKTAIHHYRKVKELLDETLGNIYVQNITEESIYLIREYLNKKDNENYKHLKKKLSKNTIASYLRHLRVFLNYIYNKHYTPEKINIKIKTYKTKKRPCPPFILREGLRYLKENNIEQFKAIMLLALTGLRSGELCSLRWEDIDFINKVVYINNSKADEENEMFPLYPSLEKFLNHYKKDSGKIIIYKNAQSFRFWAKALKDLNLEHYSVHSIRKTFATALARMKTSKNVIKDLLRHSDYKISDEAYIFSELEERGRSAEQATNNLLTG